MSKSVRPGVMLTLWNGGDLSRVVTDDVKRLLAEARPDIVSLHGGPDRLAAAGTKVLAEVRAILPGVRCWFGLGLDYWVDLAVRGRAADARLHVRDAVDLAAWIGCEAICWDPEVEENAQLQAEVATELQDDARAAFPALAQLHTSFDHPTLHAAKYPWAAWCGDDGCDVELPQVYVAPDAPGTMAPRGALQARLATAEASWRTAVARGWFRPDLPMGVYLQCHGTPSQDAVAVGAKFPVCALWCSDLVDAEGRKTLRALCALKRLGLPSVEAFQHAAGLTVDGIPGPRTLEALGVS